MSTSKMFQGMALVLALVGGGLGYSASVSAAAGGACGAVRCLDAGVDLGDQPSLQRGAKLFVNYCLSCHSAAYMRFNRMGRDLGLSDDQVKANMMFSADKVGDVMTTAMRAEDAEKWFGKAPPDLSVIARARGADWLYTYFMTFYKDESKQTGSNNLTFKDVGMPHVMADMQGVQVLREGVEIGDVPRSVNELLELQSPGSANPTEFRTAARDLTSFLVYMGEPAKMQRYKVGFWVLVFIAVLYFLSRSLYKEYWKDVH